MRYLGMAALIRRFVLAEGGELFVMDGHSLALFRPSLCFRRKVIVCMIVPAGLAMPPPDLKANARPADMIGAGEFEGLTLAGSGAILEQNTNNKVPDLWKTGMNWRWRCAGASLEVTLWRSLKSAPWAMVRRMRA